MAFASRACRAGKAVGPCLTFPGRKRSVEGGVAWPGVPERDGLRSFQSVAGRSLGGVFETHDARCSISASARCTRSSATAACGWGSCDRRRAARRPLLLLAHGDGSHALPRLQRPMDGKSRRRGEQPATTVLVRGVMAPTLVGRLPNRATRVPRAGDGYVTSHTTTGGRDGTRHHPRRTARRRGRERGAAARQRRGGHQQRLGAVGAAGLALRSRRAPRKASAA